MIAIGEHKLDLETPCYCLDLVGFESNLNRVASAIQAAGKNWRPHAKSHKSPEIARRLSQAGAIGLTCAKVSEAEIFVPDVDDVLIAHLPVGPQRLSRIAALCRRTRLAVTCDHYVQAQALSSECLRQDVNCRVLVEINIGMNRTGVRPGRDAIELGRGIRQLPGITLSGIMGYEGHVMSIMDAQQKQSAIDAALGILTATHDVFLKNGLCCDIVSAGGSGSLTQALRCPSLTEIQAGGAIFGDPFYSRMPDAMELNPALTVLTTVVSRPSFDRAVLDAGRKAITAELHAPIVKDWPDAKIVMHSAEHLVLELGSESRELKIGDQVELIVGYSDLTTMLHDQFLCFREDRLESIWPISGRGKLV